jgi:hypothetical protein
MSEPIPLAFTRKVERLIVDHTERLLQALDAAAHESLITDAQVRQLCARFSGSDLEDCWLNFVAEGDQ